MNKTNYVQEPNFQLCSVPDSEGLVLEVSGNDEVAFLEVRVDDNDIQWVRFFSSDENVALTLEDMEKAIEIAKREVINTSFE